MNTIKTNWTYALALAVIGITLFAFQTFAVTSTSPENKQVGSLHFDTLTMVNATTSNETSDAVEIWSADAVTVYFTRNGASDSVATSTFEIEVSPNGSDWYDFNKLISNVTNANSEELTRIETTTLVGATSTTMVAVDLGHDVFQSIRCVTTFASTTIETDDSNTCELSVIK